MTTAIRKQTAIWKTKDGQKIRLCDMGDRHLVNSVKLMERNAQKAIDDAEYSAYSALGMVQGEMATYYLEQEIAQLGYTETGDLFPIYDKAVLEMERRGLER